MLRTLIHHEDCFSWLRVLYCAFVIFFFFLHHKFVMICKKKFELNLENVKSFFLFPKWKRHKSAQTIENYFETTNDWKKWISFVYLWVEMYSINQWYDPQWVLAYEMKSKIWLVWLILGFWILDFGLNK